MPAACGIRNRVSNCLGHPPTLHSSFVHAPNLSGFWESRHTKNSSSTGPKAQGSSKSPCSCQPRAQGHDPGTYRPPRTAARCPRSAGRACCPGAEPLAARRHRPPPAPARELTSRVQYVFTCFPAFAQCLLHGRQQMPVKVVMVDLRGAELKYTSTDLHENKFEPLEVTLSLLVSIA